MLSIISAQLDFIDVRVRQLRGDLEDMKDRVQLASATLDNPEHRHMNLEQITELKPNGISMRYLLEQLRLL